MDGPWRVDEEAGKVVCTIPVVEWDFTEGGDLVPQPPRECGQDVYVTWSFSVPVIPGCGTDKAHAHVDAVSSSWDAACVDGHTLASSANQYSAQDDAEPFDPAVVFGSRASTWLP